MTRLKCARGMRLAAPGSGGSSARLSTLWWHTSPTIRWRSSELDDQLLFFQYPGRRFRWATATITISAGLSRYTT